MPLDASTKALVYRQAVARLSAAGGNGDLKQIARAIYQSMRGDDPFIQVYSIVQQAFRGTAFAAEFAARGQEASAFGYIPTDPSIPAGGQRYRARVLVVAQLPDGSTVSTAVNVDFTDTVTPDQVRAAAIAAVQRDTDQQLSPPGFGGGGRVVEYTATILTFGQASQ